MRQLVEQPATSRATKKLGERSMLSSCLVTLLISASAAISVTSFAQIPAADAKAPDADFYTNYSLSSDQTLVMWSVCEQTKKASGCHGSGSLGPFGKVATLMEGLPREDVTKKIVVRDIYVVDVAAGTNQTGVVLYVYTKTDHVTLLLDQVKITLSDQVDLPLVGGPSASAAMAANAAFLVVGTNQGPVMAKVDKKTLTVTPIQDFVAPAYVSAVTADWYGYITVTFGPDAGGNYVLAPDGTPVQDGGGESFMLNPIEGVIPSAFK